MVVRIPARAAVAGTRVEPAVGPELELAAVMVAELPVRDPQQRFGRAGQADGAVGAELEDAHVAAPVVEIDEEPVVLRVVRVERDREQALLAATPHDPADVQERLRAQLAVLKHEDQARLLDHVELPGLAARRADEDRLVQAGCERPETHLFLALGRSRAGLAAGSTGQRHREEREQDPERAHHFLRRTLRNSSSLPGWRIAKTWSPGCSSVEPTAISERPFRMSEISRDPSGRSSFSTRM